MRPNQALHPTAPGALQGPRLSADRWADWSDAREPITRSTMVVGNGRDWDHAVPTQVGDVIREPGNREPANRNVVRYREHDSAELRPAGNLLKGAVNGIEELVTKTLPLTVVPHRSIFEFGRGFRFKPERLVHCWVNQRRMRSRTSCHGCPPDSPRITRLARRSISRTYAASTWSGWSGGASSRLKRSSTATSARSSAGNASASRRRACALEVIPAF